MLLAARADKENGPLKLCAQCRANAAYVLRKFPVIPIDLKEGDHHDEELEVSNLSEFCSIGKRSFCWWLAHKAQSKAYVVHGIPEKGKLLQVWTIQCEL